MDSKISQKKIINVFLNRIDLENIKGGESVRANVKTNFECEIPYEIVVKNEDDQEKKDYN